MPSRSSTCSTACARSCPTSADPDEANKHILREAMATLEADLGWVVYADGHHGGWQVWRQNVDARTATFLNEAVVNEAIRTGQHVWTDDLAGEVTAPNLKLPKAFLCVPLKTGNETLGAICLGKFAADAVFTAGDLKLVQISSARRPPTPLLHRRIERAGELGNGTCRRRSPTASCAAATLQLVNKRAELTMFLADLKGFTEAAEEMEPEELVVILNEYLSAMTDIVFGARGDPRQVRARIDLPRLLRQIRSLQEDHALRAVRMAEQMQRKFAELLRQWHTETS